jgi:hypothetical protein
MTCQPADIAFALATERRDRLRAEAATFRLTAQARGGRTPTGVRRRSRLRLVALLSS